MAQIYIAFVDTPGFFAGMIRWVIKQKYIHVVLSMDAELEEAYSVGRRNPAVPLFAGFEKEDKRKILTVFPTADYMVCSIECSLVQKEAIRQELRLTMQERFHYHYAVAGLPLFCGTFHLPGKPLHLFFLRGTGIRGARRLSLGKTFFPCDTKGFHGKIWTETDF